MPKRAEAGAEAPRILFLAADAEAVQGHLLMLELDGYEVTLARDALEALSLIHRRPPDLLFVDRLFSIDEGDALLEALSADPLGDRFPTVVVSARSGGAAAGPDGGRQWGFELRSESPALCNYLGRPHERSGAGARVRATLPSSRLPVDRLARARPAGRPPA